MALLDNRHPDRADMGGGADVHKRWGSGMTEQEREELIEKMAKAAWESDGTKWDKRYNILSETYLREARAALAVAEPVIREQCAKMAESHNGCEISTREGQWCEAVNEIADAIREGGKDG